MESTCAGSRSSTAPQSIALIFPSTARRDEQEYAAELKNWLAD
jgi:hypothetical protein